jgi:hypothetical protein
MLFAVGLVISQMEILEWHLDPGLRLHPPARLRHIYAVEALTYWLTKAGFFDLTYRRRMYARGLLSKLADHIDFFEDWLKATAGFTRTPEVKHARMEIDKYRDRLSSLDLPKHGHRINYDLANVEIETRDTLMLQPSDIERVEKLSEDDLLATIGSSVELRSGMFGWISRGVEEHLVYKC